MEWSIPLLSLEEITDSLYEERAERLEYETERDERVLREILRQEACIDYPHPRLRWHHNGTTFVSDGAFNPLMNAIQYAVGIEDSPFEIIESANYDSWANIVIIQSPRYCYVMCQEHKHSWAYVFLSQDEARLKYEEVINKLGEYGGFDEPPEPGCSMAQFGDDFFWNNYNFSRDCVLSAAAVAAGWSKV